MEKIQVLIAEDDPKALETIRNSLSRLNCNIIDAPNGKKALMLMKKNRFDVIILDIGLPGLDGLEVLAKAKRTIPNLPPIIITTGYLDVVFRKRAYELGAFDYLTKSPFSGKQLRESVNKAVNSNRTL